MKHKYYIAPTDKIFYEIKKESTKIWETCDNNYGYVTEKLDRIKDLDNIEDNAIYMVKMFDSKNQRKLLLSLSKEARDFILDRIEIQSKVIIIHDEEDWTKTKINNLK